MIKDLIIIIKQDVFCVIVFLLAMAIAFGLAMRMENNFGGENEQSSNTCGFETTIEYEATKRLHYYHGTLTSYIKSDTWLFLRDGEVCSLYDHLTRTTK